MMVQMVDNIITLQQIGKKTYCFETQSKLSMLRIKAVNLEPRFIV